MIFGPLVIATAGEWRKTAHTVVISIKSRPLPDSLSSVKANLARHEIQNFAKCCRVTALYIYRALEHRKYAHTHL